MTTLREQFTAELKTAMLAKDLERSDKVRGRESILNDPSFTPCYANNREPSR